jgi:hypothetical protein
MFSATDIASFLGCPHTATLDRAESKDEIVKPFFKDAAVDLLRKLTRQLPVCRPTGSYPETGLEEINGDLLEEDFAGIRVRAN